MSMLRTSLLAGITLLAISSSVRAGANDVTQQSAPAPSTPDLRTAGQALTAYQAVIALREVQLRAQYEDFQREIATAKEESEAQKSTLIEWLKADEAQKAAIQAEAESQKTVLIEWLQAAKACATKYNSPANSPD